MMGLQAKSIESQIALNNAQASKINAETEKTLSYPSDTATTESEFSYNKYSAKVTIATDPEYKYGHKP